MKKMPNKRIAALVLAGALTLSLAGMAFAAEQEGNAATEPVYTSAEYKISNTVKNQSGTEQTALNSLSFSDVYSRIENNSLSYKMMEENIKAMQSIDFDRTEDSLEAAISALKTNENGLKTLLSGVQTITAEENSAISVLQQATAAALSYCIGSMDSSISSMESTLDTLDDSVDIDGTVRQLQNAEKQLTLGAQTLYLAILGMEDTASGLQRQSAALDRTLAELQVRYDAGQISALSLQQAKSGKTQLESGIATLNMNLANTKMQLQQMLGGKMDGNLTLTSLPEVTQDQLSAMNEETDLAAAEAVSYDIWAARHAIDTAQTSYENAYESTDTSMAAMYDFQVTANKYSYDAAVQTFELNFHKLYAQVIDDKQILDAAEVALACEQANYDAQKLKYEQGQISANALADSADDLADAEDTVKSAKLSLFSDYNSYTWAVNRGVLAG